MGPILPRGGTILGSSRTNVFKTEGGPEECRQAMADLGLDALIAIGGEDTLGVARRLHGELGLPVIGVPKTIDNDLSGTDYTFGFWTAVQIATDAIDRLHTTAESHDRVIVVEVMGRHAGWIALESGVSGGAHAILIPEQPASVEAVCRRIEGRRERGRGYAIVVVSEGVVLGDEDGDGELDDFGHAQLAKAGVAERLAERDLRRRSAWRPARWCWATSSGAARPRPSTASCPRDSASGPPSWSRRRASGAWSPCAASGSRTSLWRRP